MGSSGACARAGWAAAMGASRRSGALEDSSMVPVSFKAWASVASNKNLAFNSRCSPWVDWMKWNVCGRFSVAFYAGLPVERRNWTDNPKPEFLWVFAADKTPLLHKHSPSCPNRFANLILKHFSVPIVPQTSWRGREPSAFSPPGLLLPLQSRGNTGILSAGRLFGIDWTLM